MPKLIADNGNSWRRKGPDPRQGSSSGASVSSPRPAAGSRQAKTMHKAARPRSVQSRGSATGRRGIGKPAASASANAMAGNASTPTTMARLRGGTASWALSPMA
jgi:hypothetical protein